jgi:quinone-modifying oxidoreductase subunit QmoA
MASLKQCSYVRERYADDGRATIYYIDIRVIDRLDDFYRQVRADGKISFIRSKVARIDEDRATGNPVLQGVDTEGGHRYTQAHDLVVLAIGMEPSVAADDLPVRLVVNEAGFIEPDQANGAIFAAGCAGDALDVNRAVQSGTASALRAIQVVNRVAGLED